MIELPIEEVVLDEKYWIDLGTAAAASPWWKPLPGVTKIGDVPDFRAPGSMGVLVANTREAWGTDEIYVETNGGRSWNSMVRGEYMSYSDTSEADAWVTTLETLVKKPNG